MPYDVGYVKRRFPEHAQAIDALAFRSEDFRDLCLDLETAETTLQNWKHLDVPVAPKRYSDLSLLIEELQEEIVSLINGASVIPFGKPKAKS